jgi:DNA repair protein RadC
MTVKYKVPQERIVLSADVSRARQACVSQRTSFKYLKFDQCISTRARPAGMGPLLMRSSDDIPEIVRALVPELADAMSESFGVVCLNSRLEVVGFAVPFSGGTSSVQVDLAVLLKVPLLAPSCVAFIVFHNHPSGDANASVEDREMTRRIAQAARFLGLQFLDHVILTRDKSYSFRENGIMPMTSESR